MSSKSALIVGAGLSNLLAASVLFATAANPYSSQPVPKTPLSVERARYGGQVACRVCGACGVTLYKDGDDAYICKKCKAEK